METEAQIYDSLDKERKFEMMAGISNELEFSEKMEHFDRKAEFTSLRRSRQQGDNGEWKQK